MSFSVPLLSGSKSWILGNERNPSDSLLGLGSANQLQLQLHTHSEPGPVTVGPGYGYGYGSFSFGGWRWNNTTYSISLGEAGRVLFIGAVSLVSLSGLLYGLRKVYVYYKEKFSSRIHNNSNHHHHQARRQKAKDRAEKLKKFENEVLILESLGIHIVDSMSFFEKRENMILAGKEKLQIISDFDRTITKLKNSQGGTGLTSYGIIEASNLFPNSYRTHLANLFSQYYPLEKSVNLPLAARTCYTSEWWRHTHELYISSRITKGNIIDSVQEAYANGKILFRPYFDTLCAFLSSSSIPIIILSAGLHDSIEQLLLAHGILLTNDHIYLFANKMIFDNNNNSNSNNHYNHIVAFDDRIIHSLNKNYSHVTKSVIYPFTKDRTSVILLGDSIEDVNMHDGIINMDECISIGFCNSDSTQKINEFKNVYDVVITGDAGMEFVMALTYAICSGSHSLLLNQFNRERDDDHTLTLGSNFDQLKKPFQ